MKDKVSIGESFSFAWNLMTTRLWKYGALFVAIYFLLNKIASSISGSFMGSTQGGSITDFSFVRGLAGDYMDIINSYSRLSPSLMGSAYGSFFISLLIAPALWVGFFRMIQRADNGLDLKIGDLFYFFKSKRYWDIILAYLLSILVFFLFSLVFSMIVGLFLVLSVWLGIGGIIAGKSILGGVLLGSLVVLFLVFLSVSISFFVGFSTFISIKLAVTKLGAWEVTKESLKSSWANFFKLTATGFLYGLLCLFGFLMFFVGILFFMPLGLTALYYFYKQSVGNQEDMSLFKGVDS